eukprot:TRINITY_DN5362_c0_g1_i2.p1 TRINITY_DN5362_c0_g1~~TRINITY_DN5362_c0_g1_i2.p1  ORF type:complete len:394 (+),score=40.91 TRINITY_DN5362_c0_g1_i2:223-1404(+)
MGYYMSTTKEFGYDKKQVVGPVDDDLLCCICFNLLREPMECTKCGAMFCKACIDEWLRFKKECPNRCKMSVDAVIRPASRIVWKLIKKYDIRCIHCDEKFKVEVIEEHERNCKTPKCANPLCRKILEPTKGNVWVPKCPRKSPGYACSEVCKYVAMYHHELISAEKETPLEIFNRVIHRVKFEPDSQGLSQTMIEEGKDSSMSGAFMTMGSLASGVGFGLSNEFYWDPNYSNSVINFCAERRVAILNETAFTYFTAFGSIGFMGGIQYWEIIIDSRTQNELKIGVSKEKRKDLVGAFCDYSIGYAYYGLGELRNGEVSSGPKYGKRSRKSGIVGVCLNMDLGTLSFSLNGEFQGIAFKDKALERGPIYPAVALLRISGITLVTGKPLPLYFKQ